jgi:hypothetical protein
MKSMGMDHVSPPELHRANDTCDITAVRTA